MQRDKTKGASRMGTSRVLLATLYLLICFARVPASDPDSVRFQDSSDNSDDDSDEKMKLALVTTDSPKRRDTSRSQSDIPAFRTIWRKVVPGGFITSGISRVMYLEPIGTFFSRKNEFRRTRPDFVLAADKVSTVVKEAVTHKPSRTPVGKETSPEVPGLNSGGGGSPFSGGPGDPSDSESTADDSNHASRNEERKPSGERVPGSYDADASVLNGERTKDYQPASLNPSSREQGGRWPSGGIPASLDPSFSSEQGGKWPSGGRPPSLDPLSSTSNEPPLSASHKPSTGTSLSGGSKGETSTDDLSNGESSFPVTRSPAEEERSRTTKRKVSQESRILSGIINDFAFKLVDQLNADRNFVLSPVSIFMALAMCYLGSDGLTKSELERVLGLNVNGIEGSFLHRGMRDLMSQVLPRYGEYDLVTANALFLGRNFTPSVDYVEQVQRYYAAELKNLDFGQQELSVKAINDWVKTATRNTITSLTDAPPPPNVRLLLLSAIYFKGIWKIQFPEDMTFDGRFTSSDGSTRMVRTMSLLGETFPFVKSDPHRHSFIKLPYEGGRMSMIVALPYTPQEKPMPTVTDRVLSDLRNALVDTRLDSVTLPKFRLEYTASLRETLMRLGLTSLFNQDTKDLSKMRKENDVHASSILHKAVIDVNEQGSTASAASAVRFVPLSMRNTTDFQVNHPFAFYVVHEPTGLVLFYGKIFHMAGRSDVFPENRRVPVRNRPRPPNRSPADAPKNPRVRLHGAVSYEGNKK